MLVLKYTRNISVLKMVCYFANSFKKELKKIKEHTDITIDRINLKNGVIHVQFFFIF